METFLVVVAATLGIFFTILICSYVAWNLSRAETLLQRWAEQHGYRIISSEQCLFSQGPFFWTTSRGQAVYHVTVQDREGRTRKAWVRCGGWFLGMFSDNVESVWDENG